MENMTNEIVNAILGYYNYDREEETEELVAKCLYYLSKTTTDNETLKKCNETIDNLDYCAECGNKLEFSLQKDENNNVLGMRFCPCCETFNYINFVE